MEAFFVSILTVGVAEIGDRSLFLALLMGLRYRRPWPILAGMALGLFLNQTLSAIFGIWLFQFLSADWQAWVIGIAFLIMAFWVLIPEDEEVKENLSKRHIFFAAMLAFFLLEMADKTQLVVITLAGGYQTFWPVVLGATLGILMITTPALWFGYKFAKHIPVTPLRWSASALFLVLGLWVLLGSAGILPEVSLLQVDHLLPSVDS